MELLNSFFNIVYGHLVGYGYWGIVVMMTLESSFILFPSEICMIPAGIEVAQGNLTMVWSIFYGTLGSWIGSSINYIIARLYGRSFLEKFGKYVNLDLKKISLLDKYFRKHGNITVFVIRFIPVVRQYISFPAGLSKMHFGWFSFYTSLGAGIWVTLLTVLGASFGSEFQEVFENKQIDFTLMQKLIKPYINDLLLYTVGLLVIMVGTYIFFKKRYLKE